MKKLTFVLLVLLSSLHLKADNWLQNGDFTDGITHWHGDGRSPADYAPANPFDKPDPLTSKGMIIPLKSSAWRKVVQDFKGKQSSGIITVTYLVSPDLVFSDKSEDYQNMPGHIDYNLWAPFNTPIGNWVVFISDFGSARGLSHPVKPDLGDSNPQTFKMNVSGLTPMADKTITLAFPPGKGFVVILSVSMDDK